jgi:hypothetical protein
VFGLMHAIWTSLHTLVPCELAKPSVALRGTAAASRGEPVDLSRLKKRYAAYLCWKIRRCRDGRQRLAGDRVNLSTGRLEFVQSDVSLRGNNALPVPWAADL